METANITTGGFASAASVTTAADVGLVGSSAPAAVARRGVFHGIEWTARAGFERVLAAVPARAWAEPASQGWERIKNNDRREVWRAEIFGEAYYLKYYAQGGWATRLKNLVRGWACKIEWDAGLFALRCGIPATLPLAFATKLRRDGRPCALLVTEAVESATPLDEFWQRLQSDDDVRRRRADGAQVMERLAEMIARAHQAGFEHLDMHAANILVQPVGPRRYRTVFVDLQSARLGVPLHDSAVVRNLAQLNQWFSKNSSSGDRVRFLRAYFRWRNEFEEDFAHGRPLGLGFSELVRALAGAARRHAERLWRRRDRRLGRNGSYFARVRAADWNGQVVLRCKHASVESRASELTFTKAWWRGQLAEPQRWFAPSEAEACKTSHSALVRRAVLVHPDGNLPVIIKRPLARSWRRRIAQWFTLSRARRAWRTGHMLLHRDVATARPLAFVERRFGPLVLDSVLVTEAVPGAVDLETYLRQEQPRCDARAWVQQKRGLNELLVRHLRRLHDRGFAHRDCKASNILVVRHPEPKLLWIDMDGLVHRDRLTRTEMLRGLLRLHVSLLESPGLTRTDRVRFLKGYCAKFGANPQEWRRIYLELGPAVVRKLAALQRRREWKLAHYGRA